MNLKAVVRFSCFGVYNCGMAIFSNMCVYNLERPGQYPDPEYLAEHTDELCVEFLQYMNNPVGAKVHANQEWKGVIAHYGGNSTYVELPFYVFHDNVKGDKRKGFKHPFSDGSSLLSWLFYNQAKYGCTVVRSHMADNVYHEPVGSHPGRVYILTPPAIGVFDGRPLGDAYKKGIKSLLTNTGAYSCVHSMHPDDIATLKGCL